MILKAVHRTTFGVIQYLSSLPARYICSVSRLDSCGTGMARAALPLIVDTVPTCVAPINAVMIGPFSGHAISKRFLSTANTEYYLSIDNSPTHT